MYIQPLQLLLHCWERVMPLQPSPTFWELIMYHTFRAVIVFRQIKQAEVNSMPG